MKPSRCISFLVFTLLMWIGTTNYANGQEFNGWKTNLAKKNIDLSELKSGGPPKDGIPSIDTLIFVSQNKAA